MNNNPSADQTLGRLEIFLYHMVRRIRPFDQAILNFGIWVSQVFEFELLTLDMFISLANIGDVYPISEWGRHVRVPSGEHGPWPRRLFYKALLVTVGFPLGAAMALNCGIVRTPWTNVPVFDLLRLWGWRAAFRGVFLVPRGNSQ
jgi:hypothetical protein